MGGLDFMVKFATVGLWVLLLMPIVAAIGFVVFGVWVKIADDRKKKQDALAKKNRWKGRY